MEQPAMIDTATRGQAIARLRKLPEQVAELTAGLTPEQLTTHFLDGEWSVAQNVHHLADSHLNSYIRLKLILTEEKPTVRPYDQDLWALTPEANSADLSASLMLLQGLHQRWADLFASLDESQWQRTGLHPVNGVITPEDLLISYAAHGEGHLDQMQRTLAAQPR
ncbi:MAG: DinB family protein [Caldilineaceae bacterium]|nr:DinB family protein [Caldilineaceae bacterium]